MLLFSEAFLHFLYIVTTPFTVPIHEIYSLDRNAQWHWKFLSVLFELSVYPIKRLGDSRLEGSGDAGEKSLLNSTCQEN